VSAEYRDGWTACESFYAAHNRIPTDPQLKPVEAAGESAEAVQALLAGDPRRQTVIRALEASEYEFTTLIPRLQPAFRKNAEACKALCREALNALRD
jgi:hypothetical protein